MTKYLETRDQYTDSLNELCTRILDHDRQREEMVKKLEEVKVLSIFQISFYNL